MPYASPLTIPLLDRSGSPRSSGWVPAHQVGVDMRVEEIATALQTALIGCDRPVSDTHRRLTLTAPATFGTVLAMIVE